jgi:hypothetical protein
LSYLALLDASGNTVDPNHWFLYGGLILEHASANSLHTEIRGIRRRAGYPRQIPLKWGFPRGPGSRPVTRESHTRAALELLDACNSRGARLFVVMTPSLLTIRTRRDNRNVKFGASYILGSVQRMLLAEDDHALVIIDRPPGTGGLALFEDVVTAGIPAGVAGRRRTRYYDRIVATSIASIKASRLLSAIDVALGAFSFCLHCRAESMDRAREIYPKVGSLLVRASPRPAAMRYGPWAHGLRIRPMELSGPFKEQARAAARRLVLLGEKAPPFDTRLGFAGAWQ